jgi:hypothetical protein
MMEGAKAQYDGIKAFSESDFTEHLKQLSVISGRPTEVRGYHARLTRVKRSDKVKVL